MCLEIFRRCVAKNSIQLSNYLIASWLADWVMMMIFISHSHFSRNDIVSFWSIKCVMCSLQSSVGRSVGRTGLITCGNLCATINWNPGVKKTISSRYRDFDLMFVFFEFDWIKCDTVTPGNSLHSNRKLHEKLMLRVCPRCYLSFFCFCTWSNACEFSVFEEIGKSSTVQFARQSSTDGISCI